MYSLAYITTYIYGSSEVLPTISIYLLPARKQSQVPCGILALSTDTDLKVERKLQYYFFPCPLLLLLVAIASADLVRCCIPSAPVGVPDKNRYFRKGCLPVMYRHYGQSWPPSSPSPNTGGEWDCYRGKPWRGGGEDALHSQGIPGCFGNRFK